MLVLVSNNKLSQIRVKLLKAKKIRWEYSGLIDSKSII